MNILSGIEHTFYYPTPLLLNINMTLYYFLCPADAGVADFLEAGGTLVPVGVAGTSTFFSCFGFFVSLPLRAIEVLLNRMYKLIAQVNAFSFRFSLYLTSYFMHLSEH